MLFGLPNDSTAVQTPLPTAAFPWFHVDTTVSYIALALGAAIIVIAYFAGGRENRNKMIFCILLASVLAVLIMPLLMRLADWLGLLATPWGQIATISSALVFAAVIAAHAYEIVTVTAREARPPQ